MTPDLRSTYLGLELRSPLVASASPLTGNLDSLRALEEAGAAAVVLPSLFEEQIEHDETMVDLVLERGAQSFGEALTYFPEMDDYNTGPDAYVEHVALAKQALSIPVIASINGVTPGGWVRYAELLQQAGADAIELNVYAVETDPYASAASVEDRTLRLVSRVNNALSVPLAVKVGPYYSAFANTAARLSDAGAAGLVLFNRFLQPDIDLETMTVKPELHLSSNEEMQLPLRWIAILKGRVPVSLAATSGIQCRDARVGTSAPRPEPAHGADGGAHCLAGRARLCVGRAVEGQHEPGDVRQPARVRAIPVRARDRRLSDGARGKVVGFGG